MALGIPQTVSMATGVRSEGRRERGEEGSTTNTYHLTDKLLFVCLFCFNHYGKQHLRFGLQKAFCSPTHLSQQIHTNHVGVFLPFFRAQRLTGTWYIVAIIHHDTSQHLPSSLLALRDTDAFLFLFHEKLC